MVIDTHAHVFFLEKFIDYDDKPLFQYMEEQGVDICSCIAAAAPRITALSRGVSPRQMSPFQAAPSLPS